MAFVPNQEWHFDNYGPVLWCPNCNVDKWLIHTPCPCTQEHESSYISALTLKDVLAAKQVRGTCKSALSIQRRPYCFSRVEKRRESELNIACHPVPRCSVFVRLWVPGCSYRLCPSLSSSRSLFFSYLSLLPTTTSLVHHAGPCCHGNWRSKSPSDGGRVGGFQSASGMWSDIKHARLSVSLCLCVHLSLFSYGYADSDGEAALDVWCRL